MFLLNPLTVLLSPRKFGLWAFCLAVIAIVPFILMSSLTKVLTKMNTKKTDAQMVTDSLKTEKVREKTDADWQKSGSKVDEERSKS